MPLAFKIDTSAARRAIDAAARSARQQAKKILAEGLRKAGAVYLQDMLKRFDRLSRGGGGEWAPLKPETIERKGHALVLQDSGGLRASLKPGDPYNVLQVEGGEVDAGTAHPLAKHHHYGTGRGLPARPVIADPSRTAQRKMDEAVASAVSKMLALLAKSTPGR